jgi:hypothetical protein
MSRLEKLARADWARFWVALRAKVLVRIMLACWVSFEKVALASMFNSDSALCEAGEN